MDLTEVEDIKKRQQEYTENLLKKKTFMIQIIMMCDPSHRTKHSSIDMVECKVKWALGSITANKASRGDGILVELLQI